MLINLSNHPSKLWSDKQTNAALELFGNITDIQFPNIPADSNEYIVTSLAKKYGDKIEELFNKQKHHIKSKGKKYEDAIHLMGEMTFCYALIDYVDTGDFNFYASTSDRNVKQLDDGKKIVEFDFVRFRKFSSFFDVLGEVNDSIE